MQYRQQKAFTLIELMIVVAILCILAVIALPAYQSYMARAQVAEAVSLGSGLKVPVSEYAASSGAWPTAMVGVNQSASLYEISATLAGKYSSVQNTINGAYPSGVITVTMTAGNASGQQLLFTTENAGQAWACGNTMIPDGNNAATGTTIDIKYLPNACKL